MPIDNLVVNIKDSQEIEKDHKFWNTQPVLAIGEKIEGDVNGPIKESQDVANVRPEPYAIPAGFEWCDIDVTNPTEVDELYHLLKENYIEDKECMFRLDYSVPFLHWALTPPGYNKAWLVGVRNQKTNCLMGCITAVPIHVRVFDVVRPMAEINFLCVHKKLRTKRLVPVLIKEITRRVNLSDRWQAIYTTPVVLPKPVATCRYAHRSLNPKKLIESKFSHLPRTVSMANHIESLKLASKQANFMLRPMTEVDVPGVLALLSVYLASTTNFGQVFTSDEVAHIFLPKAGVISTYVIDGPNNTITDMCSYYHLSLTITKHNKHKKLYTVYSYYNIATTIPLLDLMRDLLIIARNDGADCFTALDVMENQTVFEPLKFGLGGVLQYYVYNWKCQSMTPDKIGIVLV